MRTIKGTKIQNKFKKLGYSSFTTAPYGYYNNAYCLILELNNVKAKNRVVSIKDTMSILEKHFPTAIIKEIFSDRERLQFVFANVVI